MKKITRFIALSLVTTTAMMALASCGKKTAAATQKFTIVGAGE